MKLNVDFNNKCVRDNKVKYNVGQNTTGVLTYILLYFIVQYTTAMPQLKMC